MRAPKAAKRGRGGESSELLSLQRDRPPKVNHYPDLADAVREAFAERNREGALLLLRQLAYFESHPVTLGHPLPPFGRRAVPGVAETVDLTAPHDACGSEPINVDDDDEQKQWLRRLSELRRAHAVRYSSWLVQVYVVGSVGHGVQ